MRIAEQLMRLLVAILVFATPAAYAQTYSIDPPNPEPGQPVTITVTYSGNFVSSQGYLLSGFAPNNVLTVWFIQDGGSFSPNPPSLQASVVVPGLDAGDWAVKTVFVSNWYGPQPVQTFDLLVGSSTQHNPFVIGSGITGNWFDPDQSGHGFSLEVELDGDLLMNWYVFGPTGDQQWIQGVGYIDGDTVEVTAYRAVGGLFPPYFNPASVTAEPWGTVTFTFADCNNGTASWQPTATGYTAGSMPIKRLTAPAGLTCP